MTTQVPLRRLGHDTFVRVWADISCITACRCGHPGCDDGCGSVWLAGERAAEYATFAEWAMHHQAPGLQA